METIGLVMIVKNESRSLEKCLSCVKELVDEIYITDTGSTDNTVEIAERFGAHISHFEWCDDFAAARNYALSQSECDWNLVLDADEYLVSGTKEDIYKFIEKGKRIGVIYENNLYKDISKEGNEEYNYLYMLNPRLFPKGVEYKGKVHEQPKHSYSLAIIPLTFEHDGYLQSGKGERNLPILLKELEENPSDPYFLFQTAHTLRTLNRQEEACRYYADFYEKVPDKGAGYRTEGIIDYLYSLTAVKDFDTAITIAENEKERLAPYADFHFVCGFMYTNALYYDTRKYIAFLLKIEQSYLKCLEIGEIPEHQGVLGCGSFKAAYNLGTWYEASGNVEKMMRYYKMAADADYTPAVERLKNLKNL